MRTRIERTSVTSQCITGLCSPRGRDAEKEKRESSNCEPSRRACPGPAHEGVTVTEFAGNEPVCADLLATAFVEVKPEIQHFFADLAVASVRYPC
jgi:hypothetical protein